MGADTLGGITVFRRQRVDREILRLAVPALRALVAEPLFLLADSAMVKHLGAASLAGLGIASAVLQTIIGLMIFLAYSTTPTTARLVGAGDLRAAVRSAPQPADGGAVVFPRWNVLVKATGCGCPPASISRIARPEARPFSTEGCTIVVRS